MLSVIFLGAFEPGDDLIVGGPLEKQTAWERLPVMHGGLV